MCLVVRTLGTLSTLTLLFFSGGLSEIGPHLGWASSAVAAPPGYVLISGRGGGRTATLLAEHWNEEICEEMEV